MEFQRRTGTDRKTVTRRIEAGQYLADATGKVPWCDNCRGKTPEGRGVEQPVEKPHVKDYKLRPEEKNKCLDWAESAVVAKFPDFEQHHATLENPPSQQALEAFQEATTALIEEIQRRQGDVTRDQGEQIARRAVQDFLNEEIGSAMRSSGGMADSDRTSDG